MPEQLLEGACHFAFVTVDVVAPEPPVVEATTVPPTAAPATTVAAAATLPVTGSSTSSTLPLFGALLLIAGAAFVAIVRRQPSPS